METKDKLILGGATVVAGAAAVGASIWSFRRLMPKPRSFETEKRKVSCDKRYIDAGSHRIYGELMRPVDAEGPLPTVICCHGFGSSYLLCKQTMAMCFAMSGLQAFVFDFYGGNLNSRSGGKMTEMSIFTEREDLNAVIDAVVQFPEVDPQNLFLLGESQGGCVSGITAPYHSDQIKAMVLYYPAFCIPDDARKRHKSVEDIPKVEKVFNLKVGKTYSEKLLDYDIYEEIKGYTRPVLIIHGNSDDVVDISYGKRASEVYKDCEFVELDGESHGFSAKGKSTAAELSYHFLKKHID